MASVRAILTPMIDGFTNDISVNALEWNGFLLGLLKDGDGLFLFVLISGPIKLTIKAIWLHKTSLVSVPDSHSN